MFGISGSELLVILIIVVLFIKPEELPKIMQTARQLWRRAQLVYDEVMDQLDVFGAKPPK